MHLYYIICLASYLVFTINCHPFKSEYRRDVINTDIEITNSTEIINNSSIVTETTTPIADIKTPIKPSSEVNSARYNAKEIEDRFAGGIEAARLLSADDQCKLIYGKESTFCISNVGQMCKSLYCRKTYNDTCEQAAVGALEGTTCGSGQLCLRGMCIDDVRGPMGDCLFGDDVVTKETLGIWLPQAQMSCSSFLDYIQESNQTTTAYCSNSNFRQLCCRTCKKYDVLTCTDKYFDCFRYKNVCASGSINGLPVSVLCPRTCERCKVQPATCYGENYICENGGVCKNVTVESDALFGFTCDCPSGFFGDLCENRNSCIPNPCKLFEKCEPLGNLAYKCVSLTSQPPQMQTFPPTTTASASQYMGFSKPELSQFGFGYTQATPAAINPFQTTLSPLFNAFSNPNFNPFHTTPSSFINGFTTPGPFNPFSTPSSVFNPFQTTQPPLNGFNGFNQGIFGFTTPSPFNPFSTTHPQLFNQIPGTFNSFSTPAPFNPANNPGVFGFSTIRPFNQFGGSTIQPPMQGFITASKYPTFQTFPTFPTTTKFNPLFNGFNQFSTPPPIFTLFPTKNPMLTASKFPIFQTFPTVNTFPTYYTFPTVSTSKTTTTTTTSTSTTTATSEEPSTETLVEVTSTPTIDSTQQETTKEETTTKTTKKAESTSTSSATTSTSKTRPASKQTTKQTTTKQSTTTTAASTTISSSKANNTTPQTKTTASAAGAGTTGKAESTTKHGSTNQTETEEDKIKKYFYQLNQSSSCKDYDATICAYYASQNLCKDYYFLNGKEITIVCPKSCKLC